MISLNNAVVLVTGANGGLGRHFVDQAVARGALLNVLSVLSWVGYGDSYSATKAALWSATNTLRVTLGADGVHVASLHLGYTDTPMTANVTEPKNDPADVVRTAYDGLEAGSFEILADDISRQVKQGLAGPIEGLYPQVAANATILEKI